ncbi:hypothetical protein [Streptomyces sp. NPDC001843]|uniref:hypothetical protein n=1 Tax=Streptomyces sp. NPDC001843 TaxID=3364617 RepID=UPI0036A9B2FD
MLREISQHTNIKLSVIAEKLIQHGLGAALPDPITGELHAAIARHACRSGPG